MDSATSTISLLRKSESPTDTILIVCNFTPVPRLGYRIGVPEGGYWRELLNSDASEYGGRGICNLCGSARRCRTSSMAVLNSLRLTLPPLGALFLKRE